MTLRRRTAPLSLSFLVLLAAAPAATAQVEPILTLTGPGAGITNQHFGWVVRRAGDADADGRSDLFVAGYVTSLGGTMYVLDGDSGTILGGYNLPNYSSSGETRRMALDVLDDVDGDGVFEVVVGDPGIGDRGAAYLLNGATGANIQGFGSQRVLPGDGFGVGVAAIGDAVGNEETDFVVSATWSDIFGLQDGALFVFDGGTGDTTTAYGPIPRPPTPPGGFFFGQELTGIGDVDLDGRGDFAVAQPNESLPGTPHESGRVYVFSGSLGEPLFELIATRHRNDGHFGEVVAPVGDIDGDGAPELFVGAPGDHRDGEVWPPGRAWLFSGASGAVLDSLDLPLGGGRRDAQFGYDVAGVGDVSGDGVPDLLVGAPGVEDHECSGCPLISGRAFVFSGATRSLLYTLESPNGEGGGAFGRSIADAGDTNGDGRPEVIVGASHENPGTAPTDAGRAYVFSLPMPSRIEPGPGEAGIVLGAPSPHPVRTRASLPFTLAREGLVRLTLHDVLGREVAVLAEGTRFAGRHAAALDAAALAPGVYLVRLETTQGVASLPVAVAR